MSNITLNINKCSIIYGLLYNFHVVEDIRKVFSSNNNNWDLI